MLKRLIVQALERGCNAIDCIRPWQLVYYTPLRWLGCPSGMALWSSQLDERWQTGEWKDPQTGQWIDPED